MACKDYVRSAASAVLATNRVLLAPGNHDSGRLRLQVPPCRCMDFHPERRPNTKRPRDHRTWHQRRAIPFSGQVPRAMSNAPLPRRTSAIENARFTCHRSQALIPHAEPSAGVRNSARRVAKASTGGCSTRPRPRRQASTTSVPKTRAARTTDHSRRARNVTAAPAAVVSQQRPTAAPRRGRE